MSMHEAAELGFERGAAAYERGRPAYPREAIDSLIGRLGLAPGRAVVDVGAGTGKLTRELLPSGAEVVAVEPVAAMRSVLAREAARARVMDGTAEALPLRDGTVDAIVAAQAFHWFDGPRALAEFHRALRPDGRLGLIWNRRVLEQSLHQAIDAIIEPYRRGTPSHRSGAWQDALQSSELFAPVGEVTLPFEQSVNREQFVDRVVSISFIAALGETDRRRVIDGLGRVAPASGEQVSLRYVTEIFVYRRVQLD